MGAAQSLHSEHSRVSGGTAGRTGTFKKDGYARGPVPEGMVATKPGKDPQTAYSGPQMPGTPKP